MSELFPNLRVLIVDDSELDRMVVRKILVKLGFKEENVQESVDGSAGERQVKLGHALHKDYDLLIVDWRMPLLEGPALLRRLRDGQEFAKLPVIMLTSENRVEEIKKAKLQGLNHYLLKPVSEATLMAKIVKIFGID